MDREFALRSAEIPLSRVRATSLAPWPDGGPKNLRSPCCRLDLYKSLRCDCFFNLVAGRDYNMKETITFERENIENPTRHLSISSSPYYQMCHVMTRGAKRFSIRVCPGLGLNPGSDGLYAKKYS
ncbi:hypothetical protein PoB_004725700 [Plakobranchus ocellatus]|uniref:Uncharacterized protein n=1 Tax=Plakobranchus ocellatus TaxID=259542 RepID=A0AAV4BN20_9GAST|nr:hypothetical protein PoB_004725700 [Plakobranchus ocellatus]